MGTEIFKGYKQPEQGYRYMSKVPQITPCRICGKKPIYMMQTDLAFPHTVYHYPVKKECSNKFCWHADDDTKAINKWNEFNQEK